MTNEKMMENLRNAIGKELAATSMTKFASMCNISYECLCGIVYKKTKSISSETIINICENSKIDIADIYEISDEEIFEKMLKKYHFTNGTNNYIFNKAQN